MMMSSGVPVYQQSMQQLDKDELHVCPYDPSHRVAAKRFVRHIIKCRKNHAGTEKSTCPFNARHIVPKPELQLHISSCPDRRLIENEINCDRLTIDGDEAQGDTSVPPYSRNDDPDFDEDEDWDREIAATETQRPNYKTTTPSTRYVWDDRNNPDNGDDIRQPSNHYTTQTSQPFPMDRRPGPPQLRSGVVGLGRGRIGNANAGKQNKPSTAASRPGPTVTGPSLAANFNVQPRTVQQPSEPGPPGNLGRPTVSRRPNRPPAYRNREQVDSAMDREIERSLHSSSFNDL